MEFQPRNIKAVNAMNSTCECSLFSHRTSLPSLTLGFECVRFGFASAALCCSIISAILSMMMTMIIRTMMPTKTSAVLKIPADMRMKKPTPFGGGDEFTDDGADDRERNARANAGKDVGEIAGKITLKVNFQPLTPIRPRQVDVLMIHLAHAGVGIKKLRKKVRRKYHADFRPESDA